MFYLVSYDIPEDKRRLQIAKTLKDFGDRVQYSVFECILSDDLYKKMVSRLGGIVEPDEDSIRIYKICAECRGEIEILGRGVPSQDPDIYVI